MVYRAIYQFLFSNYTYDHQLLTISTVLNGGLSYNTLKSRISSISSEQYQFKRKIHRPEHYRFKRKIDRPDTLIRLPIARDFLKGAQIK